VNICYQVGLRAPSLDPLNNETYIDSSPPTRRETTGWGLQALKSAGRMSRFLTSLSASAELSDLFAYPPSFSNAFGVAPRLEYLLPLETQTGGLWRKLEPVWPISCKAPRGQQQLTVHKEGSSYSESSPEVDSLLFFKRLQLFFLNLSSVEVQT
jgi:hypothetical protein